MINDRVKQYLCFERSDSLSQYGFDIGIYIYSFLFTNEFHCIYCKIYIHWQCVHPSTTVALYFNILIYTVLQITLPYPLPYPIHDLNYIGTGIVHIHLDYS